MLFLKLIQGKYYLLTTLQCLSGTTPYVSYHTEANGIGEHVLITGNALHQVC